MAEGNDSGAVHEMPQTKEAADMLASNQAQIQRPERFVVLRHTQFHKLITTINMYDWAEYNLVQITTIGPDFAAVMERTPIEGRVEIDPGPALMDRETFEAMLDRDNAELAGAMGNPLPTTKIGWYVRAGRWALDLFRRKA